MARSGMETKVFFPSTYPTVRECKRGHHNTDDYKATLKAPEKSGVFCFLKKEY